MDLTALVPQREAVKEETELGDCGVRGRVNNRRGSEGARIRTESDTDGNDGGNVDIAVLGGRALGEGLD